MSNPFWEYSVAAYNREGVPAICLTLQDEYGLDVNVLLYGAWLAVLDRRLSEAHLAAINAGVAQWRKSVVQPLRSLRRELRSYAAAAAIREEIKAVELSSERQQQDLMYDIYRASPGQPSAKRALAENLAVVARLTAPGEPLCSAPIEQLCALLEP